MPVDSLLLATECVGEAGGGKIGEEEGAGRETGLGGSGGGVEEGYELAGEVLEDLARAPSHPRASSLPGACSSVALGQPRSVTLACVSIRCLEE